MSFTRPSRSQSLNQPPPMAEKLTDDPVTSRTAQSTVTCVYTAFIAGMWRRVTVTWCKDPMHHFFTVTIHAPSNTDGGVFFHPQSSTCKVDLKPWHFWSKKGYKSFVLDLDLDVSRHVAGVEVFWDVRAAKFGAGPEPWSEFYVAVVCDGEVALLVGDLKKKAYKRTKSRPSLAEPVLWCKRECVFAKRCFSTRGRLDVAQRRRECDIVVETAAPGRDPEMWISVDGIVLVHVRNLHWKFRGNQSVEVNGQAVQVFWDVHDWLFGCGGAGRGLFVFKPGAAVTGTESDVATAAEESDCACGESVYYSPAASMNSRGGNNDQFCLFLQAWKIE